MPDITDTMATRFSNERIRVISDSLSTSYKSCLDILVQWEEYKDFFPNDDSKVIDGAIDDGRNPINGEEVNKIISLAQKLIPIFEAFQEKPVLDKTQVNGNSRFPEKIK